MHCPCSVFSAMCNYENLNLFIPQTLSKNLASVGGYCGRGGRGRCHCHHPSKVWAASYTLFSQENEFVKIKYCALKGKKLHYFRY